MRNTSTSSVDPLFGYGTLQDSIDDSRFTSQSEALARLLSGENVFLSGLAGTGKTTVIRNFIQLVKERHGDNKKIAITASTGIAATLLEGVTIHSWSALGIETMEFNKENRSKFKQLKYRDKEIAETDILIIDEISMLPAYFFINLNKVLQYVRKNTLPFGGIQLVLIGDFLQLPPVSKDDDLDSRFAIETDEWKTAKIRHCYLDKVHRAKDLKLQKVLQDIIKGNITDKTRQIIESRCDVESDPRKTYTRLYTTNLNVDQFNAKQHAKNPNTPKTFKSFHSLKAHDKDFNFMKNMYKKYNISRELTFKIGDKVILTKNITMQDGTGDVLANGSLGVIVDMTDYGVDIKFNDGMVRPIEYAKVMEKEWREVYEKDAKTGEMIPEMKEVEVASISQLPLKLGYAITVHKSQGQTFDGVETDLSKCFTSGLGYVALSRVRSMDDLVITGFNEKSYDISEKARKISVFVRKKAKALRADFIKDFEYYEEALYEG